VEQAWSDALACDPVSAFGGILATDHKITAAVAREIDELFFEVLCAPDYEQEALDILLQKKNRIVLRSKTLSLKNRMMRTVLNGELVQDRDNSLETRADMKVVTNSVPKEQEYKDLEFAMKLVKHTKSNTIVLARNQQLLASGTGQTSRVDALNQAIEKAGRYGFELEGAVMASDAFFPFPDCVEIADKSGITAVVQPGGSIKDQASIDYCNQNGLAMVMTGVRHFKH
jgi:phosphoribosylaminoimidazolecarboxamide formyltransferase/IMP cyclohydrolase